ncbi:hypothetical protein FQA39_LY17353 [Lamprigera yunnana]|nr:hypothetical protein FQA39_LY17353 [Lamprigera yunnana]
MTVPMKCATFIFSIGITITVIQANTCGRSVGNPNCCAQNSQCMPLNQCAPYNKILQNECVLSPRVRELGCGSQGSGYVCCPVTNRIIRNTGSAPTCGSPLVQPGNTNEMGAHPWVARVVYKNGQNGDVKIPCAGSIINNRVILTSAHCAITKNANYKLYGVRVGEWSTRSNLDCCQEFCAVPAQDITISHVIIHPGYQPQTYRDNVALLVLNSRIAFSLTAQPICLPDTWVTPPNYGVLVGWGRLGGQVETPPIQQAVELPIVGLQQCCNVYGCATPVSENQLCVAGRDTCEGFGGSPLIVVNSGRYYQIGFLSYGADRCAGGVPSVYTNVKRYVPWINDNCPVFRN